MTFEYEFKSFKFIYHKENRFLFYEQTRAMVRPYVEDDKLMINFFPQA